jgi:hypothetical protein
MPNTHHIYQIKDVHFFIFLHFWNQNASFDHSYVIVYLEAFFFPTVGEIVVCIIINSIIQLRKYGACYMNGYL